MTVLAAVAVLLLMTQTVVADDHEKAQEKEKAQENETAHGKAKEKETAQENEKREWDAWRMRMMRQGYAPASSSSSKPHKQQKKKNDDDADEPFEDASLSLRKDEMNEGVSSEEETMRYDTIEV